MHLNVAGAFSALALLARPITGQATGPVTPSQATGQFPSLTGTWSSKSLEVSTGPGFYDPVNENFFEPRLTGMSYSFTDSGHYEEAYYRTVANPTTPQCPKGVMQWQHGTYTVNSTGSLILTPIEVDGRQLTSDPCSYQQAKYERYKVTETFLRYEVVLDKYHGSMRLNLFQFDGTPVNAMYLKYQPPQMLPTDVLNPTATASNTGATASATSSAGVSRQKRSFQLENSPLGKKATRTAAWLNPEKLWYAGLGMVGFGSFLYFAF